MTPDSPGWAACKGVIPVACRECPAVTPDPHWPLTDGEAERGPVCADCCPDPRCNGDKHQRKEPHMEPVITHDPALVERVEVDGVTLPSDITWTTDPEGRWCLCVDRVCWPFSTREDFEHAARLAARLLSSEWRTGNALAS